MAGIIIFGGTSEGRRLAEFCKNKGIKAKVSVTSDYGKDMLPASPFLTVQEKALSKEEMRDWLKEEEPDLVIDATHPYAARVTEYIEENCRDLGLKRVRVVREKKNFKGEKAVYVDSAKEAAAYVGGKEGNILLTTGTNSLEAFTAIPAYEERIFARVLPSIESIEKCHALSIKGRHIVAMQGPFSKEMNRAMIEQFHIRFLITKESGAAGGFEEKLEGAREGGAETIVIGRPSEERGISPEEGEKILEAYREKGKRKIFLVGAGMGGPGQMTGQGEAIIKSCPVIFGFGRMAGTAFDLAKGREIIEEYRGDRILSWLEGRPDVMRCAVLYSGDTGFYSGAAGFLEAVKEKEEYEAEVVPGLPTVSYMAAKLGKSWQKALLCSMHGREWEIEKGLEKLEKESGAVFLLTEGKEQVNRICARIRRAEEETGRKYRIYAGENLSYENERILEGRPDEMEEETFAPLTALWVEKEGKHEG